MIQEREDTIQLSIIVSSGNNETKIERRSNAFYFTRGDTYMSIDPRDFQAIINVFYQSR
jgi:hypothetical protein